jgi:3-isopropylmalate/(R)-2-methylmalate dehydratase small subunit
MRIWHYGDNVNTDQLFPGKYTYTCATLAEIKPHLLEDLDPAFAQAVQPGDVIVAGRNFGCGSSREQPVVGLKAVGVAAIVAQGFARIFYRAAINQGLLLIECPEAVEACNAVAAGQSPDAARTEPERQRGASSGSPASVVPLTIDAGGGTITVGGRTFTFPKLPPEIMAIRDAGGLLEYTRAKLKARRNR